MKCKKNMNTPHYTTERRVRFVSTMRLMVYTVVELLITISLFAVVAVQCS